MKLINLVNKIGTKDVANIIKYGVEDADSYSPSEGFHYKEVEGKVYFHDGDWMESGNPIPDDVIDINHIAKIVEINAEIAQLGPSQEAIVYLEHAKQSESIEDIVQYIDYLINEVSASL